MGWEYDDAVHYVEQHECKKNIASPIIPSNSQTPKPDLPHKTGNVSCDKTEEQKLLDGLTLVHPAESLVDPDCFEYLIQFSLGFTMVVYEKIYLEALINTFVSKIWATFEFCQCTEGWLWYSRIIQQEVDLDHAHYWKSVNIMNIPKYTGKVKT